MADRPLKCAMCGNGEMLTVSEAMQELTVDGEARLHARVTCHNLKQHVPAEVYRWWSRNANALARARAARAAGGSHAEMSRG